MKTWKIVAFFVMLLLLAMPTLAQEDVYVVTFLLADSPTDQGWNAAHYRGIEELKSLGEVVDENGLSFTLSTDYGLVEIRVVENVGYNDADIEATARRMLAQGTSYMWGTWWDSQGAMSRLAEEFPEVLFEHGSGYPFVSSNGTNFSTYFIRIEEGDYVAGYVAGLMGYTEIGLVGTYPIPEPVRGVNGFVLGLRAGLEAGGYDADDARVQVIWNNSWLDPVLEVQATEALLADGYEVIRQMADTPYTSQTACAAGAIAIGYGSNVTPTAECSLVTNEWNWGHYYVEQVAAALEGDWVSQDWWGGFAQDSIIMTGWNVPEGVQSQAEELVEAITNGELDPFCGPISGFGEDSTGNRVEVFVEEGQCLSDMDLLTMQWYVDGVQVSQLPQLAPNFGLELKSES